LSCPATEITFVYGVRGKPALADVALHFNLAHSDGLAVIGVTRSGPLGIDVERLRCVEDFMSIATTCFSPRERAAIAAMPPDQQTLGFFTCWTRKDTYLKATGEGITATLSSFDVSVVPGAPPKIASQGRRAE
jgi:4'-phosphopantetheinyl transferase